MTIGYWGCFILGIVAGIVLSFMALILFSLAVASSANKRGDE